MKKSRLSNSEIAHIFYQIAEYLEMKEVAFKPRAYEHAAQAIEGLMEPLMVLYERGGLKELEELPGVGASIAKKIEELLKTGKLRYYKQLKKKMPVDVEALTAIEGVGLKGVQTFWKELGVKNVHDLERAARAGKVRALEGFGAKTEEKILKSIRFQKRSVGRFLLGEVLPLAREIEERLRDVPGVEKAVVAGSLRRRKETVGDGDVLVVSTQPQRVVEFFIHMPEVTHVYAQGETKTMVRLRNGLDFDLRIVHPYSFGAALNYFTGSKEHNVSLRKIAIAKGWKMNEYGIFRGKNRIAGKNEKEVYRKFRLAYIEPEMREMEGELELARERFRAGKSMPKLIDYDDIQGDLQVQSSWTDGANPIGELARAAKKIGLSYIAITDHTKRLAIANGLDEARLRKQMAEIDRLNRKISGVMILKGTECDILKDGSLDLPDRILAKLDVVGASVHSLFNLSRKRQTERVVRAISNPHVDILFHPTGRRLGKRKPFDIDMREIVRVAKITGTVLEANANPERLDLRDVHIHMAMDAGVKIAINSDTHLISHFALLEYGIAQARRGWAKKSDVVNAWPLPKMKKLLKS